MRVQDLNLRLESATIFFGPSRYPVSTYNLHKLPPARTSVDEWVREIERAMGRLAGGFPLHVDRVLIEEGLARFEGNGFEVVYTSEAIPRN